DVALGHITGLVGGAVLRELRDLLLRQKEADGEVSLRGQGDVRGIADGKRPGGNGDARSSAEGEPRPRCGNGVHRVAALADGNLRGADGQRLRAELVGEDDTNLRAAERDVH